QARRPMARSSSARRARPLSRQGRRGGKLPPTRPLWPAPWGPPPTRIRGGGPPPSALGGVPWRRGRWAPTPRPRAVRLTPQVPTLRAPAAAVRRAAAVNVSDPRRAPDRAGIADYRFVRLLGAGNHGVFYLAHRPERLQIDAEFVAVKVLTGSNSHDTFRRATRELAAFAAVRSPSLVTLYDAGQQGDDLYSSMESLPAGSLADAAGALPPGQVLTAVADAARAADALHEAGMAHNDIKPGNIMLHD